MLATALSILATVAAFLLLVLVHELGHFLVARWCGMRVDRFSIGFGPVIFARKRGDTEFAVSLLPLGGYVKIAGMSPGDEVDPADPKIYPNQPAWRRFLVILAGPWMNYVAAVVLTRGVAKADRFFARYGALTVFVGRWLPGVRIVAAVMAGATMMPWRRFAIANATGAFAWASTVAGLASLVGVTGALVFAAIGFSTAGAGIVFASVRERRGRGGEPAP